MALMRPTALLFLDEPESGLDPGQRIRLRRRIEEIRGRITILVASHDLGELAMMSDRVFLIEKGGGTRCAATGGRVYARIPGNGVPGAGWGSVMSIVKASFRNAVRRRWKFGLVVFVFGLGLAVLTNAYEVAATFERLESIGEEMENEGAAPSDEQVEAMARSAALLLVFLLRCEADWSPTSGEVRPTWSGRKGVPLGPAAQHGGRSSSTRCGGTWASQIATAIALVIFGLTGAAADLPSGAAPATVEGSWSLVGLLACAVSFAISALGLGRAALFGFVYFLASGVVWSLIEGPELGTSTPAEVARAVLPFVAFPDGPIESAVSSREWPGTGVRQGVLYHFALWTGVAWLGLRRIERQPLKL